MAGMYYQYMSNKLGEIDYVLGGMYMAEIYYVLGGMYYQYMRNVLGWLRLGIYYVMIKVYHYMMIL